ncbi:unnamed protein product [Gongylonema pulchrum]|uniref:RSN1_TM domain-containing protein n=1 Tax=Gongylonema pulchrum TaxID=637853 RepID=A0A183D0A1_9BILA|nr:unnamed protein product [Gongylonema pulchrum]
MFTQETAIFAAFLLISTTSLLPWNLFMNAHEYFHYKLRNSSSEEWNISGNASTELQRSYEPWVTITSGMSCAVGSLLNFLATEQ